MAEVIRHMDYLSLLSSEFVMDKILETVENIESVEFYQDPMYMGYIMRVQTKNPDFRWIVEDF